MKPTDQLLTAVLILTAKATGKSLGDTLLLFEQAGLIDHTYVQGCCGSDEVRIECNFTPIAERILEDIEGLKRLRKP